MTENMAESVPQCVKPSNSDPKECRTKELRKGLKHLAFFYATVCAVCDDPCVGPDGVSKLKSCGRCNLVSYCNTEHQVEHYKYHKEMCLVLKAELKKMGANKIRGYRINDEMEARTDMFSETAFGFNTYRYYLYHNIIKRIQRPLSTAESRIILYPRMCNICYSNDLKQLKVCPNCLCVSYCSEDHKEKDRERHSKDCVSLHLCYTIDKSLMEAGGIEDVPLCDKVKKATTRQETLNNLKEYESWWPGGNLSIEITIFSDIMSAPMTLVNMVHGFELNMQKSVFIDIVGAGPHELQNFSKWEELVHWLPEVEVLHLNFIGPDVRLQETSFALCSSCCSRGIDIKVICSSERYHDFINTTSNPDLIIAFNAGFSDNIQSKIKDTWKESIPVMLSHKCPLVVTSYTEIESKTDLAYVKNLAKQVELLVPSQRNNFHSYRPFHDWEFQKDESMSQVYYKNYYIFAVTLQ